MADVAPDGRAARRRSGTIDREQRPLRAIEKYSGMYSDGAAEMVRRVRQKDVDDQAGEVDQHEQLDPAAGDRCASRRPRYYGSAMRPPQLLGLRPQLARVRASIG